jgi:penicillin-binding protein 1A
MTWMLREVVQHGTAVAAAKMPYALAGKTGTTNDFTDAWFVGFSPSLTAGAWVGYDEKKSLGSKETGGRAALPIWIEFMTAALAGKNPGEFQAPPVAAGANISQKIDTPDLAPGDGETR